MNRLALAAFVAVAIGVACTLVNRQSDFFDPNGRLVTIYTVDVQVDGLVLTTDDVVINTSSQVFRVPKTGGSAVVIADGLDLVHDLASDQQSRVGWCQGSSVQRWDAARGMLDPIVLASGMSCETVAVSKDRIVYTASSTSDDGGSDDAGAKGTLFYSLDDGGASPAGGFGLPFVGSSSHRLVTVESTYFIAGDRTIFREKHDGDVTAATEPPGAPTCLLGNINGLATATALFVDLNEEPAVLAANTSLRVIRQKACCSILGLDASCAAMSDPFPTSNGVTLHAGKFYYLVAGGIAISTLADVADGSANAATIPLGTSGETSHLAVDDESAFFLLGDRIERLSLTAQD